MKKLLTNFNKKEFKHINYFSIVACVNDLNSKEGERTIFGVVEPPYNIIDLSKAFCKIDNFSLDNKKLYGNVTYINNLRYGEFGRRLVEECKFGFKLVYTSKSFQDATYMSQILTWYIDINKQQTNVQPNKEDYDKLLNSGMFWEFHPELSGDWNKDKNLILDIDTKQ